MVSPLTHPPSVLAAYLRNGEEGLSAVADRLESEAHDRPNGKFSKKRALYLPQAPVPPTLWRTSCGRCRFWEAGEPGEPGECHIVGREDDPFGGEAIHYRGWCALWMPPEGEPAFAWVRERLRPSGKTSVRGRYDPELTERERRRQEREPKREDREPFPTEPDARQVAVREDAEWAEATPVEEATVPVDEADDGEVTPAAEEGTDDGGDATSEGAEETDAGEGDTDDGG